MTLNHFEISDKVSELIVVVDDKFHLVVHALQSLSGISQSVIMNVKRGNELKYGRVSDDSILKLECRRK